jgi:hypothetical protein
MFTIFAIATTLFLPPAQSPPTKGWALLDDASKRAVKYFIDQSDAKTGFTKDRAVNFSNVNDKDHVVASIAAIGFALSAYGISAERGWMPREDAIKRSILTLKSMRDIAPKHHGWFYHWINAETGAREWKSEVSTIDSAILWCGMILNSQALKSPEIARINDQIFSKIDWKYMRTNGDTKPKKLTITMGWHDETGFINGEWNEYSENAMIYLLQLGFDKNSPDNTWTSFQRKQVNAYGKMCLTGGPLFLHQMSQIFFDFKNKRDILGVDYWENSRVVTLLQRQYGKTNPKKFKGYSDKQWGLSACDIPSGYGAQGFPGWGDDNGTLAPPAAIASVMFTRKESSEAAEEFMRLHPSSYGRYGFAGGINAHQNWIAPDAIGIDLGQMMLAIENARDGLPNKLFMQNPQVQIGMKRAGFRVTIEKIRPIIK